MVISFILSFGNGARFLYAKLLQAVEMKEFTKLNYFLILCCYNKNFNKYLINTQWRNITSELNTADHNVNNIQDIQDP